MRYRPATLSLLALLLAPPAVLTPPAAADPRIPLVELQVASHHEEALAKLEEILAADPEAARLLGLHYLRGHLLLHLDRRQEALDSFAATMSATPQLGPYSRYRLALEQDALGHPEVAAGLVATMLRSSPPSKLIRPAMRLLRRAVLAGGDCGVLRDLDPRRYRTRTRRELDLALAECRWRDGEAAAARQGWLRLLEQDRADPVARAAAERLAANAPAKRTARTEMLIGLTFHHHREFDVALKYLARAVVQLDSAPDVSSRESYDLRYALARSHFWEGRYAAATAAFAALAAATSHPKRKAQALYQEARCHELAGRWSKALPIFQEAYGADPRGGWADAALISALRLQWRRGHEDDALKSLGELQSRRHYGTASRALLFIASSELVDGRGGRVGDWLRRLKELRRVSAAELHYWQGRLDEIEDRPAEAVESYRRVMHENPYHPFGQAAWRRLRGETLVAISHRAAVDLAASASPEDLYSAWLLLAPGDPRRKWVREKLEKAIGGDQRAAVFLKLEAEPAAEWPLWSDSLEEPEEMLLALGLFQEGSAIVLRHFPVARPALAFTGSQVLARSGDTKRSLYIAEILRKRVPRNLPAPLLPTELQELLFPAAYNALIRGAAEGQKIDPHLLAALIREESRFDPRAFSAASARGLTQFVFPTARTIAARSKMEPLVPRDLERPEIAIALGAAYLRLLHDEFDSSVPEVVAAYNAGEPQAALWRRYCLSDETEEYLTKVAFRETRAYVAKVLTSRAHYTELYPVAVPLGRPD